MYLSAKQIKTFFKHWLQPNKIHFVIGQSSQVLKKDAHESRLFAILRAFSFYGLPSQLYIDFKQGIAKSKQ